MLTYTSGLTYLRRVALSTGLILESDNDDILVQRIAEVLKGAEAKLTKEVAKKIVAVGATIYDPPAEAEEPEPETEPEPEADDDDEGEPASGGFGSSQSFST